MSAFEISVTPSRLKQKKRMEGREPTVVVMAPFSAKAIVQFEDVPINKTAKRIVRVLNPSDDDIEVKVTKAIKEEHNLSIEWTEHIVPARDEVSMELVWNPSLEVACKETLHLLDNRNFRKDVMIILKSRNNQPIKNTRKFPTVGKTLQLKSPTGGTKTQKSVVTAAAVQQKKRLSVASATVKATANAKNAAKQPWRNVSISKPVVCRPSAAHAPLTECNAQMDARALLEHQQFASPKARNYKENVSPMTPGNYFNLIDGLKFTPVTETRASNLPKSLANLPTPVIHVDGRPITMTSELRPRRLTAAELAVQDEEPLSVTAHVLTDKTFNIKHSETLNISADTLDCSRSEIFLQTPTGMLNKTTTISHAVHARPLACIHEEEGISPSKMSQMPTNLTPPKNRIEDLKRDIQVVGSPLRKYSESMKDLSLLSPQTKIAIQGSMPNLNECIQIRSIDQNRYYQQQIALQSKAVTHLQLPAKTPTSLNSSICSETSIVSHPELLFNQNEILAQSSRFNLHEVGRKSRKCSPVKRIDGDNTTLTATKSNPQKRRSHELSFSDAPSNESLCYKNGLTEISPPKRQRYEGLDNSTLRNAPTNASAQRNKVWNHTQPKKFKLAQTLSLMKKPITPRKTREERPVKLYDSELYLQTYINPDPFAATTTIDPFLASTMYLDEKAVERHQSDFKKWLNALVTMPADLDADINSKIDVGKLFNEVRNKELVVAPTKEEQSVNYLTKYRLESLRRAAVELFFSEAMRLPCSKVAVYVNKQALRIRSDRNLHLDVVMQRTILELLLCFNPLWLRLGLEVVFGEKIHLHSNRDIVGISTFILNRLFRNKFEEQKFSKAYTLTEEYAETIKKHTLQKMLFLLLFLDKAKQQRIIKHNPCLFVKKSPHKETKDILLRFSSELLANIGDITRELRRLGYVLQHKQTFLDEFDYAFNNLAIDLRDGVRLTRVMEVILLRDDLTKQLRVPAISRLQRIFNVKLALTALSDADFKLGGDISAPDIVDGHREKTLSLLWQIIYKFRSPKFHAAARVLQQWWRRRWLHVCIMRRIRYKEQQRCERAATIIQAAFRAHQTRKYIELYREERVQATIVLQKYARRYLAQKQLYHSYRSVLRLQRWWRAQRSGRSCRQYFLQLRESVIFLQRIWRRRIFSKKLLATAATLRLQLDQKRQAAAACIQMYWHAYRQGKAQRRTYLRQQQLVICVQQRIRAKWLMRQHRTDFQRLRNAALVLQQRWRARCRMQQQRAEFQRLRCHTVRLQLRWRAVKEMRTARADFLALKHSAIAVQQRWQARCQMKQQRKRFQKLRTAAIVLQRRYRARLAMIRTQSSYQQKRQCLIKLQQRWRATLLMREQRRYFLKLRSCVTQLQSKTRAKRAMQQQRGMYELLRNAALIVQRRWRANRLMQQQRAAFKRLRSAAITIQHRYRAHKSMRFLRAKYRGTMTAVTCLQMHWRGYLLMKRQRSDFLQLRQASITLQQAYRRRRIMLQQRDAYRELRCAVIKVQQRYRARLEMRRCQREYLQQRQLIVQVQRRYRARLAMISTRAAYAKQRKAAVSIQRWYRSLLLMRQIQLGYRRVRDSALRLQRRWRATLAARRQREIFLNIVERVKLLQRQVRATLLMRAERLQFKRLRAAAVVLQRRYRAQLAMRCVRVQYQLVMSLAICVQRKFRARRLMLQARHNYQLLQRTTIHLQQKFRGKRLMLIEREHFLLLRRTVEPFQARVRGFLARQRFQALMTPEMMEFLRRKRAAKIIQCYWRGYRIRKQQRHQGLQVIRKRVLQLRREAKAINSVRSKVQESVKFLRGRFIAADALAVLNRLDRLSRTVPHLLMWCSEFMSTFCYGIMAQAIRSEVDKQLIERCSRIILNLARYNSTTVNTFQESGLVTIAQMLLRWCDKDSEIFNTLCTLIWVFAHCAKKRKIIHEYMTNTEAIYMVRETKKLVARKEKMKQNARKPPQCATVRNAHQQQQPTFSPRALPSLEPDFGIIRYRPYTFISSVYAFDTILCKLGVDIF